MRDFIFLKNNAKYSQIFFDDIQYVESVDKYVRLVTTKQTYLVLGCLCHLEKWLPADQFCRIHRSYIVSFRYITEFTSESVTVLGKEFPIGRQYKETFYDKAQVVFADITMKTSGTAIDKLIENL